MKAIGIHEFGSIENLKLVEIPRPVPEERDLIVRIKAIGVNPVDTKKRRGGTGKLDKPLILGWDAAGIVEEVGSGVKNFKVGDEVYYSGSVRRQGTYAEFGIVDERLVGHKPKSLSFEEAAAIPLVAVTGWEALVEQLGIPVPESEYTKARNAKKTILIVAGAGGTGSIGIQIAKRVLGIGKVIATASRQESIDFCKRFGADEIIDHKKDLKQELNRIGLNGVDYIYNCSSIDDKYDALSSILSPLGKIVCIVETDKPLQVGNLMGRRGTFTWELMFTRSMYGIDMEYQGEILNTVSNLLDKKILKTTLTKVYDGLHHIQEAHRQQESGTTLGKQVLKAIF